MTYDAIDLRTKNPRVGGFNSLLEPLKEFVDRRC
jgi:hypothetical protein